MHEVGKANSKWVNGVRFLCCHKLRPKQKTIFSSSQFCNNCAKNAQNQIRNQCLEMFSEPCQTSKMKRFAKIFTAKWS